MSETSVTPGSEDRALANDVHDALRKFSIYPVDSHDGPEPVSVTQLRRGLSPPHEDVVRIATLTRDADDVLRWTAGTVPSQQGLRRGRGGLQSLFTGKPITTVKFAPIGENEVASKLEELDTGFKRSQPEKASTLRAIKERRLVEYPVIPVVEKTKKILLFVHGTFSNNDNLLAAIFKCTQGGGDLIDAAEASYDQVLAFDHYTLSRSPILNALELARFFAGSEAQIDVICHSRGGLVTRWFFEVMDHVADRKRRAVLVGCPLGGTSLAAPDKLRSAIDLFTNLGSLVSDGVSLIPFLSAAGAIMKIGFSVAGAATRVPLIDAGVAMIPGLACQSRVTNNFELRALTVIPKSPPQYWAVTSEFKPEGVGWKFWHVFCSWGPIASAATTSIFLQPNDLVVDTLSMTDFATDEIQPVKLKRFCEKDHVHHTLYFENMQTLAFIRASLEF